MIKTLLIIMLSSIIWACGNKPNSAKAIPNQPESADTTSSLTPIAIVCGAENTENYFHLLHDKKIAIVANQSSLVNNVHLLDTLISAQINVVKVFCPEHGFRGDADAGAVIDDSKDTNTGVSIISLYGQNKKPNKEQLAGIDILLFDLQDVGARFYTYISTLHYVMESCAENNIKLIVLDRPNPNGYYVDGPILDTAFRSFIGMHPVPIVHGMSIGEYALMINGEKWLSDGAQCELEIIKCKGWDHQTPYDLPVRPSPNLPNYRSIQLYPSLCLLEGTIVSIGRGTEKQFQIIGHPLYKSWDKYTYNFTPKPNHGAKNPKLNGEMCYGFDLSDSCSMFKYDSAQLNIDFVIQCYQNFPQKDEFFKSSFKLLCGSDNLKKQLIENKSEAQIRQSWEPKLSNYKEMRMKYLLYED